MAGRRLDPGVRRLLDANLNRAREGLRVLEDTARFRWNARSMFEALRRMRHGLDRTTRRHYPMLVSSRDAAGDAGRRLAESARRTPSGLVAANFRRAEEALRVLEEYGKVLSPGSAGRFKSVRFELYQWEKAALKRGAT